MLTSRTAAVFAVFIVLTTTRVGAQSLADAAKRAQDASAANKAYTPKFDDNNLAGPTSLGKDILSHPLKMDELRKWRLVVHDVTAACEEDKKLRARLEMATEWATTIGEIERAYIIEPKMGAIFTKHGMTVHDYVINQVSLTFALAAVKDRKFATMSKNWGGRLSANADVVRANREEAEAIAKEIDHGITVHVTD